MIKKQNSDASRWRCEFAAELMREYMEHPDVRVILLGGSPAKGLADPYSDLDIIVYWETMDEKWIESKPLCRRGGEHRLLLKTPDDSSCMELYYFETLIVEVGHCTIQSWNDMTAGVLEGKEAMPWIQKSLSGFLQAKPLYGSELYDSWKKKMPDYPDQLAEMVVKRNLGFFWKGCLLNQGLARGEILFFYDGICGTLRRVLGILGGINRVYFSADEPRWIEHELSKMPIQPQNTWQRIQQIFEVDRDQAIQVLEALIQDTVNLVEIHMPSLNLTRLKQSMELEIRSTLRPPRLSPVD